LQGFSPNASHGGFHRWQGGDNIAFRPDLEKMLKSTIYPLSRTREKTVLGPRLLSIDQPKHWQAEDANNHL
jgi:hypothetical protein